MKAFLIDVGSTFIKYSVYDPGKDALEMEDAMPFPSAKNCKGEVYHVDVKDIDRVINTVFPLAKAHGCKSIYISVQI